MLVDISGLYDEVCLHAAFANGESCGFFICVALGNHGFVDHIGPFISHHSYWMNTVPPCSISNYIKENFAYLLD